LERRVKSEGNNVLNKLLLVILRAAQLTSCGVLGPCGLLAVSPVPVDPKPGTESAPLLSMEGAPALTRERRRSFTTKKLNAPCRIVKPSLRGFGAVGPRAVQHAEGEEEIEEGSVKVKGPWQLSTTKTVQTKRTISTRI